LTFQRQAYARLCNYHQHGHVYQECSDYVCPSWQTDALKQVNGLHNDIQALFF